MKITVPISPRYQANLGFQGLLYGLFLSLFIPLFIWQLMQERVFDEMLVVLYPLVMAGIHMKEWLNVRKQKFFMMISREQVIFLTSRGHVSVAWEEIKGMEYHVYWERRSRSSTYYQTATLFIQTRSKKYRLSQELSSMPFKEILTSMKDLHPNLMWIEHRESKKQSLKRDQRNLVRYLVIFTLFIIVAVIFSKIRSR